jgi:antitoxin ParD1/3/4
MNTIPISLPEDLTTYLQSKLTTDHYPTPSDYIQALLQQDQAQDETQLDRLETLALEGINSGPSTPMTQDDWDYIRRAVRQNLGKA